VSEGGLGQVHFGSHLLHPGLVGPGIGIQQADGCGVACERPVGEGVDNPDTHKNTVGRRRDRGLLAWVTR
jgi:hypothetical protein